MSLTVVNILETANEVDQPFALLDIALVGELSVHLYICQGQLDWHKHFDEDELFFVYEGLLRLETELGSLNLHADECAVVPKGITHRTGSALRSVAVLARTAVLGERKNGHRRLHSITAEARLRKGRLARPAAQMPPPYMPETVARLEGYALALQWAEGVGPPVTAPSGGTLLVALRGVLLVETKGGGARLETGELTALPGGTPYTLTAPEPALAVLLQKEG